MVPLSSLWIPILVSAVLVFVVSSVLQMLLPVHKSDFRKLPKEDETLEAMGKLGIPPGDDMFPLCSSMGEMKDPKSLAKMEKGPVGMLTVMPRGPPAMGASLALWQNTIWYKRSAVTTLKSTIDGLVYALCTAGVFEWLWPR